MPARLTAALALGAVVAASGLPLGRATAATTLPAADGPRRSVVLELAVAPGAAVPGAATRGAATAAAAALGLRVDGADAASLSASGPAALVGRLFPTTGRGVGAILATPAALRGSVDLVVDPADRTRVAHDQLAYAPGAAGDPPPTGTTNTGVAVSDLTAAYGGSAPGPAAAARTRPTLTAQTPIIATLQLAGWEPALLTRYAHDVVFTGDPTYDPVKSGQYVGVAIDRSTKWGGDADTLPDGEQDDDSDAEVALDQEAVLAAAPGAKQRAYFASNSSEGYLAALDRVAADRAAGMPIVAFSTSWGSCEAVYDPAFLTRIEGTLRRLVDMGVTLFAASGDDGINDCARDGRHGAAVDYPASSVYTVGVGGSSHPNGAAAPAPDTAWVDEDPEDATQSAGSGGGVSGAFGLPSWQARVGGSRRAVPDLALPADTNANGILIDTNRHEGRTLILQQPIVGGTSLASPLAAAMLTNYLIGTGFPAGVKGLGDIHRSLYAAAHNVPTSFTDVVAADGPNDQRIIHPPSVGYDQATGLGTPNFAVLGPLLSAAGASSTPAAAPTVTVPVLTTTRVPLQLAGPTGTLGYFVSVGRDAGCSGTLTKSRTSITAPPGSRTVFAHAVDSALVCSQRRAVTVTVALDDRSGQRTHGWTSKANLSALAHTYSAASAKGSRLTWTVSGGSFAVLLDRFSGGGSAQLLVDGRVVRTVSTKGRTSWANRFGVSADNGGGHTVSVVAVGNGEVRVDGVVPLS